MQQHNASTKHPAPEKVPSRAAYPQPRLCADASAFRRQISLTSVYGDWSHGNQFIGQYLSVRKDSFSNPPTHRRLEEAVVVDCPKMMKFKAS
ncbi:hypothetical protein AVEN_180917-1 [Araneus ventricosus]|uniref:Uncharacterized protein n=1 Tax=Araneus ventricosus TaxID=182803 RepID=A0A4Y2IZV2_ARAVE|nr:hypothetical protein AVEN_180917-1 [Araneus ventricosus]